MALPEHPIDSDALRANIASTAHDVVIPDRYQPLVDAVDGFHGVRAVLVQTLEEYFHAYRSVDHIIDGFQTILLRNWTYFERSDDRARLFDLLAELVLPLLDTPLSSTASSALLRQLAGWCSAALKGERADEYEDGLRLVGETLTAQLPRQPIPFLERDTMLKGLVDQAVERPALAPTFLALYRPLLLAGLRRLTERLDVPGWATSAGSGLTDPSAVAGHFAFLAGERLDALTATVESAPDDELLAPELPLFSELISEAIDGVYRVERLEDRFAVCLYLLKDDTLGHRQSEVMADLLGVLKQLLHPERHMDAERILSRLTAFFRDRDNEFMLMRFRCYEAIGVAIGEAGNVHAADHLIDDILYWRFQYPDIRGATDKWQTVVNPFHLPKIRCWMHIIESNPALYERLAAALNVQLRLGGVYIADTDLFQRDVSRYLAADIRPIYFVAKQLLRTLPVYFNEVGAEGELRAVSTEIDELCGRHDTLMHFLRKQSHTESSNRLVTFSREVLRYWATLDPSGLQPFLSDATLAAVRTEAEWAQGPHGVLAALRAESRAEDVDGFLDALLASPSAPGTTDEEAEGAAADDVDRRRVSLMVRTHQLLAAKYSLSAAGIAAAVDSHLQLTAEVRDDFERALAEWRDEPRPTTRDTLIDASLAVLEELKAIILDPAPSTPVENIYHKRHIAAGIPSVYGTYHEPRFDALGLSFRLEKLVGRLFEEVVDEGIETYVTRDCLRRMARALHRFERALAVDGAGSRALGANLSLLEASFSSQNFTFHQYQNVFQFLASSVTELSTTSILSHDQVLRTVLARDPRQCEARGMPLDAVAEMLLREVLVSALGLQELDRYVAAALRRISTLHGRLNSHALTRMMNYDPERLISPIHTPKPSTDDQLTLGFKGLGLKQMALYGHRVPEGFILTTELYDARPAMSYGALYDDTIQRIRVGLGELERQTGRRLGDRSDMLLLSVRSGAAISMPGLMTTFVNVGLNEELAEALSAQEGYEWAAWDAYRRFLQSWGMSAGIERDFFDDIMIEFKRCYSVDRKIDFSPELMREMALTYRERARDEGVVFVDDPFTQVTSCVLQILESWDSAPARLYRQYTGVAEEWGTAVVIQRMVFGNLSRASGSGVTFTHNPLEPYSRQVRLFGDFTVGSQGEDLVGGLVFPLPISEAQRRGSATYEGTEHSLERDYPEIYRGLLAVADDLVEEREFDPQELEFTFESPAAEDLYVLQKRAVLQDPARHAPYFDTSAPGYTPPVAVGMGVAGGAFSGRVAINARQIDALLAEEPDEPIVVLRPDTVPEDIDIITRVSGILTARGGATSHAAVTAKRLGKTAVVDCRDLDVVEHRGTARLAGTELRTGEWISIDGRTGAIHLGRLPTTAQPPVVRRP